LDKCQLKAVQRFADLAGQAIAKKQQQATDNK